MQSEKETAARALLFTDNDNNDDNDDNDDDNNDNDNNDNDNVAKRIDVSLLNPKKTKVLLLKSQSE